MSSLEGVVAESVACTVCQLESGNLQACTHKVVSEVVKVVFDLE